MRIASGTVKAGSVIVEGEPLPDGSYVTLLVRECTRHSSLIRSQRTSSWGAWQKPTEAKSSRQRRCSAVSATSVEFGAVGRRVHGVRSSSGRRGRAMLAREPTEGAALIRRGPLRCSNRSLRSRAGCGRPQHELSLRSCRWRRSRCARPTVGPGCFQCGAADGLVAAGDRVIGLTLYAAADANPRYVRRDCYPAAADMNPRHTSRRLLPCRVRFDAGR